MSKVHELIAVSADVKGQATKVSSELMSTFQHKPHLFRAKTTTFRSKEENIAPNIESKTDIQSTLVKELDWVSTFLAKAIDSGFQIDRGNAQAVADLIIEDENGKIAIDVKGVHATQLLQLEKHLAAVRDLALTIPTLDPAQGFEKDSATGYYKARDVVKERTKKIKKPLLLAPATDKHPAQVQVFDADEVVGTILEQEWSALTTPALKSKTLARIDNMIQAVKRARAKANNLDIDPNTHKIGKQLLTYAFAPLE